LEAAADGGSSYGVFAAVVNADEGTMAAASIAAGQLRTTTAIANATIGQRSQCRRCNCVITTPSHRRLRRQQLPLTKITIAAAAQSTVNSGGGLC
jgi:hypothetical protein